MNFKDIITDRKFLLREIDINILQHKTLDRADHMLLVSCLWHAEQHGDITLAGKMIGARRKSERKNAMIRWVENHSPFQWDGKGFKKTGKNAFDIQKAIASPFWNVKNVMEGASYDIAEKAEEYISRLMAKADKEGEVIDWAAVVEHAKVKAAAKKAA